MQTFEQWWEITSGEPSTPRFRQVCELAYNAGAENAYPALATVCAERNQLQVDNLKLRKALKDIGYLFEVLDDNRK